MQQGKYDIFISYRRQGGAQYARILQLVLQQHGYRVFLDYDELTDGRFGDNIKNAIREAPVFIIVLSEGSMKKCANEGDWVRQEIMLAIESGRKIVPVNPEKKFDGFPEGVPERIVDEIGGHQFSEISFGQTLGVTVDFMIEKRIAPCIGTRKRQDSVDTDGEAVREKLKEMDSRQKRHNRIVKAMVACGCLIVIGIVGGWLYIHNRSVKLDAERQSLIMQLEKRYADFGLDFQNNDTITVGQLNAIDTLLYGMQEIRRDSLYMGMFEVTERQWNAILKTGHDGGNADLPVTGITGGECLDRFILTLQELTHIPSIDLPTEAEWRYAAGGGESGDSTLYAGGNDINEVAWYRNNSGGRCHRCDGEKLQNGFGLFNMSGNVSEMCYSSDAAASGSFMVVCGGSFASPAADVTTSSVRPLKDDYKDKTIGFRIVIRKE